MLIAHILIPLSWLIVPVLSLEVTGCDWPPCLLFIVPIGLWGSKVFVSSMSATMPLYTVYTPQKHCDVIKLGQVCPEVIKERKMIRKIKQISTSFTPFNRDFISSSANNLLPSNECFHIRSKGMLLMIRINSTKQVSKILLQAQWMRLHSLLKKNLL